MGRPQKVVPGLVRENSKVLSVTGAGAGAAVRLECQTCKHRYTVSRVTFSYRIPKCPVCRVANTVAANAPLTSAQGSWALLSPDEDAPADALFKVIWVSNHPEREPSMLPSHIFKKVGTAVYVIPYTAPKRPTQPRPDEGYDGIIVTRALWAPYLCDASYPLSEGEQELAGVDAMHYVAFHDDSMPELSLGSKATWYSDEGYEMTYVYVKQAGARQLVPAWIDVELATLQGNQPL